MPRRPMRRRLRVLTPQGWLLVCSLLLALALTGLHHLLAGVLSP